MLSASTAPSHPTLRFVLVRNLPDPLVSMVTLLQVVDALCVRSVPTTTGAVVWFPEGSQSPAAGQAAPETLTDRRGSARPQEREAERAWSTNSRGWQTSRPAAARCSEHPGLALATTDAPERATAAVLRSRMALDSSGSITE